MKKILTLSSCILFLILTTCCLPSFAFDMEGISTHGYISQGYLKSDDNNYLASTDEGTFEFTEIGFNVSKEFDKVRVAFQLISRDLGEFGNNEIELDWALGEYYYNDYLGIRIGKIKMPMGFYNQERDVDMLRVSVLLPASVYDEGSRDIYNTVQGAEIYGTFSQSFIGALDYELFYGSTDVNANSIYVRGKEDAVAAAVPAATAVINSIDAEYTTGAALRWSPQVEGLRLGVSYYQAEADLESTLTSPMLVYMGLESPSPLMMHLKFKTFVQSIEYTWNNLSLATEYCIGEIISSSSLAGLPSSPEASVKTFGWYVLANYRFNEKFALGIYYSEFFPDKSDRDGDLQVADGYPDYYGWQKEIVPTIRFDLSDHFIIKGEVHLVDGAAQVYAYNNPAGREKDWTLYALKATFNF